MSGLLNYNRRSELRRDHNLKISILIWKHSSAGMSVRLTRERSWVRAPLFPSPRLGSENTGTEPSSLVLMGKMRKKVLEAMKRI